MSTFNKPWKPAIEDVREALIIARPKGMNPLSRRARDLKIGYHANVDTRTQDGKIDRIRNEITSTSRALLDKLEADLGEINRNALLEAVLDPYHNEHKFEGEYYNHEIIEVMHNGYRINVRNIIPNLLDDE